MATWEAKATFGQLQDAIGALRVAEVGLYVAKMALKDAEMKKTLAGLEGKNADERAAWLRALTMDELASVQEWEVARIEAGADAELARWRMKIALAEMVQGTE